MINKIVLNNVASYREKAILSTDKKINLVYGLNGVGKSTLSDFLYDMRNPRYSDCRIEGLSEDDTILVYNQKFVQDIFFEDKGIHGIFTLSKENAAAKRNIENAKEKIDKINQNKKQIIKQLEDRKSAYEKTINNYKDEIWKIKKEYSGGDRVLEFCLTGLKNNREVLFEFIKSLEKKDTIDYSIDLLKKEATEIQGDSQPKKLIEAVNVGVEYIENSELLSKVIVGNRDSSIANLINMLHNADWVNRGLEYVTFDGDEAICPFCQKRTISHELIKHIKDYFDESYQEDKNIISDYIQVYKNRTSQVIAYIEEIKKHFKEFENEIETYQSKAQKTISANILILEDKLNNPSKIVVIESLTDFEKKINEIIVRINKEISEYNKRIQDIQGTRESIKLRFWYLMRNNYDSIIELYLSEKKKYDQYEKKIKNELNQCNKDINFEKTIISSNQKNTVNIDEAVNNIKAGLIDIGITDFTIEKYSEEDALYKLKRGDNDEAVFNTLSEGEKMVISFLYFIELCKGQATVESAPTNKIIVIDDPISSLSHIYIFNIGRLIHNEFLRTEKYNQIFVLTHSLYFFYELTNINHTEREETQKLFRIEKDTETSSIVDMKYEEIQNDYQTYWYIIKNKNQAPALIANCMRNIIEYFFNFVEKHDLNEVFNKKELKEARFQAFNRYMNRESHSKGQNIFDIKEFDYDSFREAFKMLFKLAGYEEHYKRMMKELG